MPLSPVLKAQLNREKFRESLIDRRFSSLESIALTGISIQQDPLALLVYAILNPGTIDLLREIDMKEIPGDFQAEKDLFLSGKQTRRKFADMNLNEIIPVTERDLLDANIVMRYGKREID